MADSVVQTSLIESKFVYFTGILEIERESKCKQVLLKIIGLTCYFFCSLFFFILPIKDYLNHLYNKELEVKIATELAEHKADLKLTVDLRAIEEKALRQVQKMEEQKALIEKGDGLEKAVRELQEASKHLREFEERMYKSHQVLNTIFAVSVLADCYRFYCCSHPIFTPVFYIMPLILITAGLKEEDHPMLKKASERLQNACVTVYDASPKMLSHKGITC